MNKNDYDLTLYYLPGCPYCQKVFNYMEKEDIEIPLKNIKLNKKAEKELINTGGKKQVPCLFINGDPLYESDDIIKWFHKNYS